MPARSTTRSRGARRSSSTAADTTRNGDARRARPALRWRGVASLECRNVHLRLGATDALRGASVDVQAGEIVALRGRSGSGKSTLLHCLAGILRPDSGSVSYGGTRIDDLSERDRSALRRDAFGFVFQAGMLVPDLPLRENVMLPLLLTGARRREAGPRADAWLERLGLLACAHRLPAAVSGGQAQRAALARALIHRPRVVFADEPTGALDSEASELVVELLTSLVRDDGAALVLVTHDAAVAAYADREVMLLDGAAVQSEVAA